MDPLGDHLCTCVIHSDVLKTHDWLVDQITDLFHTTHKVKTQHELFGSSTDPSINGHLHYPNELDRTVNESSTDKIPRITIKLFFGY